MRKTRSQKKEDENKNPGGTDQLEENQNGNSIESPGNQNRKRKMASAEVARHKPKDSFSSPPTKKQTLNDVNERLEKMQVSGFKSEEEILQVARALRKEVDTNQMDILKRFNSLILEMKNFLDKVSKAKAAKLVRDLVEMYLDINAGPEGVKTQIAACKEYIEWARDEKRTFLRQSLEARLIGVYYDQENFNEALALGGTLLKELKKVDDKNLLVEVLLLESRTYHSLGNLPKARAALTSARTTANGIYCPPKMQAALDLQSGILHAADERDFKTAYSYFYEAFEGLDSIEDPKALQSLKYMLLSKIMLDTPDEVTQLLSGKLALKYEGRDLDAMRNIALAAKNRSLADFQKTQQDYVDELSEDPVVKAHFSTLYDKMMEQNLSRIIEPYSRVQVAHVAAKIKLDQRVVEQKLSQMILDEKLTGVLDQANGLLIIFESNETDKAYEAALGLVQNMGNVVDALYHKAKRLT